MRKYLAIAAAALALLSSPALADWTGKDASNNTITFVNPNTCTSVACVPIAALVNAAGGTLYGTAGASNAAVLSVQGIASGTALPISGTVTSNVGTGTRPISIASGQVASGSFSSGAFASGSYASGAFAAGSMVDLLTMRGTVAGGTAAANSMLAGGVYNSTPITMTNGQGAAQQFDVNGYLKVNVAAGGGSGGTSSSFGAAFPGTGTAIGFTDGTNMAAGRVGAVANVAAATGFVDSLGICQYLASQPTITDTRFNQIQCDVNGNLRVSVSNTNPNGQAALASSSPVAIAKNSGTGATVAGAAVGTAGTPSAEYLSVQGVVTGLPVSPGTLAGGATFVSGTTAAMTGTTSTQIIALVSSQRIYVTRIKCNNSSGTATMVQIRDGSAGTVLDTLAAGATYGGEQGTGSTPLFWTTAGTALYAQNVTTGASVICTASGYSG